MIWNTYNLGPKSIISTEKNYWKLFSVRLELGITIILGSIYFCTLCANRLGRVLLIAYNCVGKIT